MAFYSRRHYNLVSPPSDTAEDISHRRRMTLEGDAINREITKRWPVITAANVGDVFAYQQARLSALDPTLPDACPMCGARWSCAHEAEQ